MHGYTNRGYDDFSSVIDPFLNMSDVFDDFATSKPGAHVLEIGCGSGNFLLDAQSRYPSLRFSGSNFDGWGGKNVAKTQIDETLQSALNVASTYNISLECRDDSTPVLPRVYVRKESFIDDMFALPVGRGYDLIVSRDALNVGKVNPKQADKVIPRLVKYLGEGGMAVCHLVYFAFGPWDKPVMLSRSTYKEDTAVGQLGQEESYVTVYFFQVTAYITIVAKKCRALDVDGTCPIPFGKGIDPDLLRSKKMTLEDIKRTPNNHGLTNGEYGYGKPYLETVFTGLKDFGRNNTGPF